MIDIKFKNIRQRDEYGKSIVQLIETLSSKADMTRKSNLDKEALRKQYIDTLGYPLNCYEQFKPLAINVKTESLTEDETMTAVWYQLEVMENFWFSGILYEPKEKSPCKNALVIAQHGGGGSAEIVGSLVLDSDNYNHMVKRVLRKGISVFAPQLLLWSTDVYKSRGYNRNDLDHRLKQFGGSITALEIFCIKRSIDYFSDFFDENKIGMLGLSYGGMYALYTAAADTRIKSTLSSCWFGERLDHIWTDWVYFNQLNVFSTEEAGSLVLPRKLYVEIGKEDDYFSPEKAELYLKNLEEYAKIFNCADSLKISVFDGDHELDKAACGIEFFIKGLLCD